jgi:hypothetical protein
MKGGIDPYKLILFFLAIEMMWKRLKCRYNLADQMVSLAISGAIKANATRTQRAMKKVGSERRQKPENKDRP